MREKIDSLQEDEKELTEKLEEYSNELANFEGGIKGLVELSKAFEEMKKPYIDLFIEVSDLKSQITGEIPKSMTDTQLRQLVKRKYDDYVKGEKDAKVYNILVSKAYDYILEKTKTISKPYLLRGKSIEFSSAVKGKLLGMVKEHMKSMEDGSKPDENKLEEEYSEKKEELSKMELEITKMIVASPYFDKKAKGTRIAGELILNRENKSMWHKSVVSDTRKKEYFSAKETFMGIQLEGQIKNEAVSIFEIMGGSYSMNLDAVTDFKKLNRQLKKLTKRIESAITIREKIDEEFAEKTKKVLEEEE